MAGRATTRTCPRAGRGRRGRSGSVVTTSSTIRRRRSAWPTTEGTSPAIARARDGAVSSAREVDLAVRARAGLRALDEVQPPHRGAEQPRDELHPRRLRADVEQALLGVEAELDGRGHLVGGHPVE